MNFFKYVMAWVFITSAFVVFCQMGIDIYRPDLVGIAAIGGAVIGLINWTIEKWME